MEVEKVRPLVEKNIISKYELQSNQYTLQSMQALLAAANADLVNARVNVGYTYLPALRMESSRQYRNKKGRLVSSASTKLSFA